MEKNVQTGMVNELERPEIIGQESSLDLWVILRQVLQIPDQDRHIPLRRGSYGFCNTWTTLAYQMLTRAADIEALAMSTIVETKPVRRGHEYLNIRLPSDGKITVDGARLERLLRRETKKLQVKYIPRLRDSEIHGAVLGSAGDYVVLDGTADQFFDGKLLRKVQPTGFYGAPQRAPKLLAEAYAEGTENGQVSDYLNRFTEKKIREVREHNRKQRDFMQFGIRPPGFVPDHYMSQDEWFTWLSSGK